MIYTLESTQLLIKTKTLVSEERRITLELIDHLREIERRMLFAELGYGSLFEFCTRYLNLSEGSAQRRIAAMRLARDLPEARASMESGSLSLSNAAKLHSAFPAHKKSGEILQIEEKRNVLTQVSCMSQRACEQKLYEVLPIAMKNMNQEKERAVTATHTEIKLVVGPELQSKLKRLKELLSHSIPDGSTLKVLEHLADQEITRLERKKGITLRTKSSPTTLNTTAAAVRTEKLYSGTSNNISAHDRRSIWHNAGGKCEFPGCNSRYKLEVDHKIPRAQGGPHSIRNLRLLCANSRHRSQRPQRHHRYPKVIL